GRRGLGGEALAKPHARSVGREGNNVAAAVLAVSSPAHINAAARYHLIAGGIAGVVAVGTAAVVLGAHEGVLAVLDKRNELGHPGDISLEGSRVAAVLLDILVVGQADLAEVVHASRAT